MNIYKCEYTKVAHEMFMRVRRTSKVQQQPALHSPEVQHAPALTATDKEALQRSMHRLRNAHSTMDPLGFLTSEGTQLLCTAPSEMYNRLTTFLSNISIVAGLTLSAIASVALEPIDIEDVPGEQRVLADAFNVTAAVTVVIQLMVVLYATYTLYIVSASVHTPTAAYRATLHMTRWLGFLQFCSYLPALGALVLIVLAAQLRCGTLAARVVLVATPALWLGFTVCFDVMVSYATPYSAWHWSGLGAFGLTWLSRRTRTDARVQSEILFEQAMQGVLGEDDDGRADDVAAAEAEEELASWLERALSLKPTMGRQLARRLFATGLTHARMVDAAAHAGGFQTLCDLLATATVGLRPGDALALASAAMRDADKRDP
jgi:hypothetical protein